MNYPVTSFQRAAASSSLLLAVLSASALASVPGEVQYQGLLLDNVGSPITASVDLDFQLFDAPTAGTLLWTESHTSVAVLDGVYEVALGSTTPLDSSVLGGGAVYLEVTAAGETLTPRQRLLAVPYALRAADSDSVSGLSGVFVTEVFEHFNFDGDPPSNDPREGLGDADGDGIANFIDPDNDNDTILDSDELQQGNDINLPTPIVTAASPSQPISCASTPVQVQGVNFAPGLTVVAGSQSPVASSVTPTTFDITVGPQPLGPINVIVTNPNGEVGALNAIEFVSPVTLTGLSPAMGLSEDVTTVLISGSSFGPGMTVVFGSQTPTPYNVTPTTFNVDVGPQPEGVVNVSIAADPGCPPPDSTTFTFADLTIVFATSTKHDGNLGGAAGADAICAARAAAAGLSGSYLAWIADGTTAPATRFVRSSTEYSLRNFSKVADNWADLTDASLDHAINADEFGAVFVQAGDVWTGVGVTGAAQNAGNANNHCNGFTTNSSYTGVYGADGQTNGTWTYFDLLPTKSCSELKRIYCFEQ